MVSCFSDTKYKIIHAIELEDKDNNNYWGSKQFVARDLLSGFLIFKINLVFADFIDAKYNYGTFQYDNHFTKIQLNQIIKSNWIKKNIPETSIYLQPGVIV